MESNLIQNYRIGEPSLEEVRQNFNNANFMVGFTINLPRVKKFITCSSRDQEIIYIHLLKTALARINKNYIVTYDYDFEQCRDGQTHIHGVITSITPQGHRDSRIPPSPIPFIMDLDRCLRLEINKAFRLKKEYTNTYNDMYQRIKKPAYCLQVLKDVDETHRWLLYMTKQYRHKDH